jgi:hypothetical protein
MYDKGCEENNFTLALSPCFVLWLNLNVERVPAANHFFFAGFAKNESSPEETRFFVRFRPTS